MLKASSEISTNKDVYGYGESIEVTIVITNNTAEEFVLHGSSTCQAYFIFDEFDSSRHSICTADYVPFVYPPGASRTYIFEIEPNVLGLPLADGEHTIVGQHDPSLIDSTTVTAPGYTGGRLSVGFASSTSQSDVASLKDSLSAAVIETYASGNGISEIWEIEGVSIDSAEVWYSGDSRFRYFEAYRIVPTHTIVSLDDEFVLPNHSIGVFPNPCTTSCSVSFAPDRSGEYQIQVTDVIGRLLVAGYSRYYSAHVTQTDLLPSGDLAPGVYFARISSRSAVAVVPFVVAENNR